MARTASTGYFLIYKEIKFADGLENYTITYINTYIRPADEQ